MSAALQWIIVSVVILMAVYAVVRRLRRKSHDGICDCGCTDCALRNQCSRNENQK